MKKTIKKALTMTLALAMVIGMMPFAALADDNSQIVSNGATRYFNANGKNITDNETALTDYFVSTSKMISQTGENAFDITLTVETAQKAETIYNAEDYAVVMLLDTSNSMNKCIHCGEKENHANHKSTPATEEAAEVAATCNFESRLEAMRAAATEFTSVYSDAGQTDAQRLLSIVTFDGSEAGDTGARTVLEWEDVANNAENAFDEIDALTDTQRETRTDLALAEAQTLVAEAQADGIENVIVVLMSDGQPWIEGGKVTTEDGSTIKIDQATINVADALKNDAVELYTVFIDNSESTKADDGEATMKALASSNKQAMTADNTDELTEVFDEIATEISTAAEAWTVNDPMGDFIKLNDEIFDNDNVTLTKNGFEWDLKSETPDESNGIFTYELTYSITLNTAANKFVTDKEYDTNGKTRLTFVEKTETKVGDGETVTTFGKQKTVGFQVPVVKGEKVFEYEIEYSYINANGKTKDIKNSNIAPKSGYAKLDTTIDSGYIANLDGNNADWFNLLKPVATDDGYYSDGEVTGTTIVDGKNLITVLYTFNEGQEPQPQPEPTPEPTPSNDGNYRVTIEYVDTDGNEIADDFSDIIDEGVAYDMSDLATMDIAGYTFVSTDDALLTGDGNGATRITIVSVYEVETTEVPETDVPLVEVPEVDVPLVDVPEVDVPLVETPEIEVPEIDIPMVDVPFTSDPMTIGIFGGVAVASALGLGVTVFRKKEEDDMEDAE